MLASRGTACRSCSYPKNMPASTVTGPVRTGVAAHGVTSVSRTTDPIPDVDHGRHRVITRRCCRIGLYGICTPPAAAQTWLRSPFYSCARSGRSRLLRAAWRPCSRGPDRRAAVVAVRCGSAPVGCVVSCPNSAGPAEIFHFAASDVPCLTDHGTTCPDGGRWQSARK